MQLGNESEALEALKKAVTINSNPDLLAQAWYQLATVYRRTHRMPEAQQALATFQKLKDQESEHHQKVLEEKLQKQNPQ
jgi:tetratricopeptide (TPR) repeat protein